MLQRLLQEIFRLFKLGIPLVVAQLAVVGMQVTDTIFVGQTSTKDLAAMAIGSGIWATISVFIMAGLSALAPIIGQLYGSGKIYKIPRQFYQGLWLSLSAGVLSALLLYAMPLLISFTSLEKDIADISGRYLQSLAPAGFAISATCALRYLNESLGNTRPTMLIYSIAFCLNIVLDYLFIFGHFGFPQLGAIGCGIATSVNCWIILVFFIWKVSSSTTYKKMRLWKQVFPPNIKDIKHHLHVGLPISFGAGGEVLFFGSIALLLAPFGISTVSGHQIALNFGGLIFMIPIGMCQALAIRVSQHVGAGQHSQAVFTARAGLFQGVCIAIITASLTVTGRETIAHLYSDDIQVIALAMELLLFCAAFQVLDALQILAWGALRGYKDTRTPMLFQLTSYWLIGFPIGYSLSLTDIWVEPMGAYGFWIGIIAGLTSATILLNIRLWLIQKRHTP